MEKSDKKMKEKIIGKVAISNRHVHLTKETYDMLFDEPITVKRALNQVGEYAALETVTLKTDKAEIPNVRVMGPCRKYNQVEISRTDAYTLGLNPPVRQSGDLENSETITVVGPKGEVTLENACIQAQRHIHMNPQDAQELGLNHQEKVKLIIDNDKGGVMEAFVKVSDNGFFEIHLDKDDANCFLLKTGDEVVIEK